MSIYQTMAETVIKELKRRNMEGFYCPDRAAAAELVCSLVPQGASVSWGGSATISLIFLSALLTTLGLYDNIAKYAGAGTLVPITGFANSMVSPALEFKAEGFVTGLGAKLFSVAGPVLVFGITASVVYGLILYLLSLL